MLPFPWQPKLKILTLLTTSVPKKKGGEERPHTSYGYADKEGNRGRVGTGRKLFPYQANCYRWAAPKITMLLFINSRLHPLGIYWGSTEYKAVLQIFPGLQRWLRIALKSCSWDDYSSVEKRMHKHNTRVVELCGEKCRGKVHNGGGTLQVGVRLMWAMQKQVGGPPWMQGPQEQWLLGKEEWAMFG